MLVAVVAVERDWHLRVRGRKKGLVEGLCDCLDGRDGLGQAIRTRARLMSGMSQVLGQVCDSLREHISVCVCGMLTRVQG